MSKYYNDIAKTPLHVFVDCYVDDNLDVLIIEGNVPRITLAQIWENMREEFAMAIGSQDQRTYLKLLKDTNDIAGTMNQSKSLIEIMKEAYHPVFGRKLNSLLKTNIQWPDNDRNRINRYLVTCENMLIPLDMKLEMKKAQMATILRKLGGTNSGKPTRDYFDLLLNLVEEHFGVPTDYNIMVTRFCNKVNRMYDQLKKKKRYGR